MAHAYRSLEPGAQIVITDEPRPDLEGMARWESIDAGEAQTALDAREDLEAQATLDAATQDKPADVPGGPTDEETAAADALAAEAAAIAATEAVSADTPAAADDALDIDDAPAKTTKSRSK